VLVGKGITFDTGGISLKPAAEMDEMKFDMSGAGSVLGALRALAGMRAPVNVIGVVPTCENMPGGAATRPGDIVKTLSGQTVEVLNTDAEGRLILCDALAEADSEQPALIVDMATLTGAARVALGPDLPALFANDDALAAALLEAGTAESDPLWRMPLWKPYRKLIDSKVADLNNVSESGFAGAVIAALYLAEFVSPQTPWAHIDTYAWNQGSRPGRPEGAEALGLRALYGALRRRFGGNA
jgi:leucyl aminopeptidase